MNTYKFVAMKRKFIVLIIAILPLAGILAQNPNIERLNAYKIGFFTKKLNLTSEEAERFWPVYNEYQKQKNSIQQEKRELIRKFNQDEQSLNNTDLLAGPKF